MNLFSQQLLNPVFVNRPVRAGIIGTGHFATAIITQSQSIDLLDVPIVADLDVEAAMTAYHRAEIPDDDIAVCDNRQSALLALEQGKRVITTDALLLMDLPIDVVVESTGVPEAGAQHAYEAIRHGKHVAMVSKETDVTVGPMLAHLATEAGVVYTPVDGDQHGLLIALVEWARQLGLEVLCAGKARDTEFIYDGETNTASTRRHQVTLSPEERQWFRSIPSTDVDTFLDKRQELLADLPQIGGFDLVEMAIATNATGLLPDRPMSGRIDSGEGICKAGLLHCPTLYTTEIPQVFCPKGLGGILENRGVMDAVTCLRYPHEAGLMGGVFIVIACVNEYSRYILSTKGAIANHDGSAALIQRPYHLCGVETPMSILRAALLGMPTAVASPRPVVDVVARAKRPMQAGEILGNDHSPDLEALMHLAQPVADKAPLPFHMGNGNRLIVDVPAGAMITPEMVESPGGSRLWTLRAEQDVQFWDNN